jgi:hypothetical protein
MNRLLTIVAIIILWEYRFEILKITTQLLEQTL